MIKILYIHHGGIKGGAPRSLAFLISKLDKTLYEPYVLCMFDEDDNRKFFESVGAKVIFDGALRPFHGSTVAKPNLILEAKMIIKAFPTYYHIKKLVSEIKPDIIHLNSTCLFVAAKAIKDVNKNIPVICHVREPLLSNLYGKILKDNCNKYVDEFIAIDKFDAETVNNGRSKINIIYNFVDFNIYNSNVKSKFLRDKFNIPEDGTLFLYLARVADCNGALEMVKCLVKNNVSDSKMYFVIAGFDGTDSYMESVKSICRNQEHIFTMNFSDRVQEMIASSDVMVCPFKEPHFARAIIEAAAMGKPAIASDIGGPQELIINEKTGLLFDNNDFQEFYNACLKISDKNLREEYGNSAEKYALENFNADINAEKTFDVYKKLIAIN